MLISVALSLAPILPSYERLRGEHPEVPARIVLGYLRDDEALTFDQYRCAHAERGHRWLSTGSAYGGDDESYGGEGRAYCSYCGCDGDA